MSIIPQWRAEAIAKIVGCDAHSILEILEGWRGRNLSQMTEEHIAEVVTNRLDSMVKNP